MAPPLAQLLSDKIKNQGPISVEEYITNCLYHPEWGYYLTQNPIGSSGDYITAPEMTQVFGELIGLWAYLAWQKLGCPAPFALVEMGPGHGTLMADLLRISQTWPDFSKALEVHLLEISPTLMKRQKEKLGDKCIWHKDTDTLPASPTIFIANEFFDALPFQQMVFENNQWFERGVNIGSDGFEFCLIPLDLESPSPDLPDLPSGTVVEFSPFAKLYADVISQQLRKHSGAGLFIDYGYENSSPGDTLQALSKHRYHDPLNNPGEVDLTCHVDFGELRRVFLENELIVKPLQPMGVFLQDYGLEVRTQKLYEQAQASVRNELLTASARLISPQHMGQLFKVLEVFSS